MTKLGSYIVICQVVTQCSDSVLGTGCLTRPSLISPSCFMPSPTSSRATPTQCMYIILIIKGREIVSMWPTAGPYHYTHWIMHTCMHAHKYDDSHVHIHTVSQGAPPPPPPKTGKALHYDGFPHHVGPSEFPATYQTLNLHQGQYLL